MSVPSLADALRLHREGDLAGAIRGYRAIIAANAADAGAASNLGVALRATGDNDGAIAVFEQAIAHNPEHNDLAYNYGNALRDKGEPARAAEQYSKVLARDPAYLGAGLNLALVQARLGKHEEAARACLAALKHHPLNADLYLNLGVAYWRLGRIEAAVAAYTRGVGLDPKREQLHYNLGIALEQMGDHSAALASIEAAMELAPDKPDTLGAYGQTLISLGRTQEALAQFERALALQPDHLDSHLGTARALLLEGRLAEAWDEYEWHRKREVNEDPNLPGERWDGSDPKGKTILVYGEQGFGDTIQFARYCPLLAAQGAKVILRVVRPLVRLMSTLQGPAQIVTPEGPLPVYDFTCPMMDLPRHFKTDLATIPAAVPYLRSQAVHEKPTRVVRVGLVWAGSTRHQKDRLRSLRLDDFAPLFKVAGVSLFSLQLGEARSQLDQSPYRDLIADAALHIRDFADTADILQGLDLLISADTAIAHLAGALALPVWMLTPYAPDWRWLLTRADTPWYPTMRLLRQAKSIGWSETTEAAADALRTFMKAKLLGLGKN